MHISAFGVNKKLSMSHLNRAKKSVSVYKMVLKYKCAKKEETNKLGAISKVGGEHLGKSKATKGKKQAIKTGPFNTKMATLICW